jgi:hypothetical protein
MKEIVVKDDKGSYIPSFEVFGKYTSTRHPLLLVTLRKDVAELFTKRLNKNKKRWDRAHKILNHYSDMFLEKYCQEFAKCSWEEFMEKMSEYYENLESKDDRDENLETIQKLIDEAVQNDLDNLIENHPAIFSIWETFSESHFDSFEIKESKVYVSLK